MPPKIGEILVGAKAITADVRDRALGQRAKVKGRFGSALLEVSSISEMLLLRALSVQRQVPPANASDLVEIRPDILRLVPAKLAAKLFVVPFRRVGRTVSLAMLDPTDLPAVDEITFLTGLPIAPHIGLEVRINTALHRLYGIEVSTRFLDLARRIEPTAPRPAAEPPPRPPAPVQASIPTPKPMAPPVPASNRPVPLPPPPAPGTPPPPPPAIRRGAEGRFTLPESGDPWGDGLDAGLATDAPIWTEVFEEPRPASARAAPSAGAPDAPGPAPAGLHPPPAPRPAPPLPTPAPAAPARVHEIDDEDLHRLRSRSPSAVPPAAPAPLPPPPEPAPEAVEPALGAMPEAVVQQPSEAALAEPPVDVEELPPPSAAGLVERLSAAEGRDDVADAVLEATKEHLQKAALFIVQSERVIGWAARPEPAEGFRAFSLPFKTASVFATLRNTDGFYAGPCPELPGNREILAALSSSGLPNVAVVPVTIRGKTVLFLFGEASGSTPVNVTPLKRLATMTATALEIILLRNRLRNM